MCLRFLAGNSQTDSQMELFEVRFIEGLFLGIVQYFRMVMRQHHYLEKDGPPVHCSLLGRCGDSAMRKKGFFFGLFWAKAEVKK